MSYATATSVPVERSRAEIEVGISTVEQEFLAWTVLLRAAETGQTPRLLIGGGA